MNSPKNLLPSGFYDQISEMAFKELETNLQIIKLFRREGFNFVRPSIMEFEQSLDKNHSSEFFKVTDPISGKMMVLRNDITPQIARIIKDRFEIEIIKKPIKISYSGQVFRKNGKGKFAERQITQTGLELINESDISADSKILEIIYKALKTLKINSFTIDFCIPSLLLNFLGMVENSKYKLIKKAIEDKNLNYLQSLPETKQIAKIIKKCDEASDAKEAIKILAEINKKLPKDVEFIIKNLELIIKDLLKKIGNFKLSLNIFEAKNFHYHTGVCYSIISDDNYEEIVRGGRYKIKISKEKSVEAVGATIILNSVLRCG
ncbi:MAG: ATP phosphoribosyltransferase regulatory subunit [Rickettsiales bacterium]|nr:ATP phosphoribosyltransferase regulatory subunit [Rickettsiales bacterium]